MPEARVTANGVTLFEAAEAGPGTSGHTEPISARNQSTVGFPTAG
jgi:hypothetical protein